MIVRSRERTRAMRSSHMARRGRQPNPVDQASLPSPPRLTRYDLQMFHGHLRTRKVISKAGLRSLIHLDSDKLPKDERCKYKASSPCANNQPLVLSADMYHTSIVCNICYVAFGESSPDGVTETPVKIPACSHVFGGNCLKTWLEESPCCPYCRHQLPSENRFLGPLKESVRDALMGHGIITTQ